MTNSRRRMPDTRAPPSSSVRRTISLPPPGRQVLGAGLNCSEFGRGCWGSGPAYRVTRSVEAWELAGRTRGTAGLLGNADDIRCSSFDCRPGVLPEHWARGVIG